MTWNLNSIEFESVTKLAPEKRYEYFIKKVADWQEIWSLWNEGWVLMGDSDEHETVPVWPHAIFAEASAVDDWLGYKPRRIGLADWMEKWIPGIERDRRMIAVFPTLEGQTTTVNPARLKHDLEEELARYE